MIHIAADKPSATLHTRPGAPVGIAGLAFALPEFEVAEPGVAKPRVADATAAAAPLRQEDAAPGNDLPIPGASRSLPFPQQPVAVPLVPEIATADAAPSFVASPAAMISAAALPSVGFGQDKRVSGKAGSTPMLPDAKSDASIRRDDPVGPSPSTRFIEAPALTATSLRVRSRLPDATVRAPRETTAIPASCFERPADEFAFVSSLAVEHDMAAASLGDERAPTAPPVVLTPDGSAYAATGSSPTMMPIITGAAGAVSVQAFRPTSASAGVAPSPPVSLIEAPVRGVGELVPRDATSPRPVALDQQPMPPMFETGAVADVPAPAASAMPSVPSGAAGDGRVQEPGRPAVSVGGESLPPTSAITSPVRRAGGFVPPSPTIAAAPAIEAIGSVGTMEARPEMPTLPANWRVAPDVAFRPVVVAAAQVARGDPALTVALPVARGPSVRGDQAVPDAVGAAAIAAAPTAITPVAEPPVLDLGRDGWPADMMTRIERLRDAADAVDTRIRLLPDMLGSVEVDVRQDGDTLHVRFTAEQAQTRALLQDAQPRLVEAAEARGLKLGGSSVDAGAHGQHRQPTPQPAAAPRRASSTSVADRPSPADDARIA